MHARVTTIKCSPDQLDDAFSYVEDNVRPRGQEADGFKGIVNLGSQLTGVMISISFWDSEDHLEASEEVAREARTEGSESIGFEIVSVERYEARVAGGQLTLDGS